MKPGEEKLLKQFLKVLVTISPRLSHQRSLRGSRGLIRAIFREQPFERFQKIISLNGLKMDLQQF